jgi:hypothetical protein
MGVYRWVCHDFLVAGEAAEHGQGHRLEHELRAAVRAVLAPQHARQERVADALRKTIVNFTAKIIETFAICKRFNFFVRLKHNFRTMQWTHPFFEPLAELHSLSIKMNSFYFISINALFRDHLGL